MTGGATRKMGKTKRIVCWMTAFLLAFSAAVLLSDPAFNTSATNQTNGYYIWKVEGKTNEGYRYGSWRTVDRVVVREEGGTLDVEISDPEVCCDKVTGDVKVSYSSLETAIDDQLDGGKQSVSIRVRKEHAPAGTYDLKVRPVYQCWKVEQQRYERIGGRTWKSGEAVYCYVQTFSHMETTVVSE